MFRGLFVTILIEPALVGAWLAWMIATRRFESPSIDPPRAWFRHQLRRLPWLAVAFGPIVWGLRIGFGYLIRDYGGAADTPPDPFEIIKVALLYGLWLLLFFGLLTLKKRQEDSERMLTVRKHSSKRSSRNFRRNCARTSSSTRSTPSPR